LAPYPNNPEALETSGIQHFRSNAMDTPFHLSANKYHHRMSGVVGKGVVGKGGYG